MRQRDMYISNTVQGGGGTAMKKDRALVTIGMAAEMLGVHPRTLRNYEDAGLISPRRKGSWRYYTVRDLRITSYNVCYTKLLREER